MNYLTSQAQLDAIAEDFVQRRERGESPSIKQYQHRYPEFAEQVGSILKTIQFIYTARISTSCGAATQPIVNADQLVAGARLGVYEIQ